MAAPHCSIKTSSTMSKDDRNTQVLNLLVPFFYVERAALKDPHQWGPHATASMSIFI